MSADKYLKCALSTVENILDEENQRLMSSAKTPFTSGYRPEIDTTPELSPKYTQQYQQLISILRWLVELGRVDIMTEVSMMSSHNALPREGHLQMLYHIFSFLKSHDQSTIVFDDRLPTINARFSPNKHDWTPFYKDAYEEMLPRMPTPLGNPVSMYCFIDSDHAGNLLTRKSQTGFLIYLNCAPVVWYSKRQNTVESSSFGSEFVAMRQATNAIEALRYKLCMFGIPIEGPCIVYGDNQSVITNSSAPQVNTAQET